MYSTSKWAVESTEVPEPVEFPRRLIWKRTLLLGILGISVGLGGGYFLGQSKTSNAEPADSAQRPTTLRVKFLPLPDADPGERALQDGETFEAWMPPAKDSPAGSLAENLPPRRHTRPAVIKPENSSPRQSDKG